MCQYDDRFLVQGIYVHLNTLLQVPCKCHFFFDSKDCQNIDIDFPLIIPNIYTHVSDYVGKEINLLLHCGENHEYYIMVSKVGNNGPINRAEYLVYRTLKNLLNLGGYNCD